MVLKYTEYIKETVLKEKEIEYNGVTFRIGDKVSCEGTQDDIKFKGEIGVITLFNIYSGVKYVTVKFPIRFNTNLHLGADNLDLSNQSYDLELKRLTLIEPFEQIKDENIEWF
jgi:hypothetical protein